MATHRDSCLINHSWLASAFEERLPMDADTNTLTSRRQFLKAAGGAAAVSALAGARIPQVHAAGSELIQVALVGCGGRGSGAAFDALGTSRLGPIKLVAMADA